MKGFHSKNVTVDIDRVARFAILAGWLIVAKDLVDEKGANLESRDVLGRSAIFYAAKSRNSSMLKYVGGIVGNDTLREEMSHHDTYGATPLHCAVMLPSRENAEFCLAAGADPDARTKADKSAVDLLLETTDCDQHNHIRLLLTLNAQLKSYLEIPIYVEGYEGYWKQGSDLFKINELQSDEGPLSSMLDRTSSPDHESLAWIHIPWTNVS